MPPPSLALIDQGRGVYIISLCYIYLYLAMIFSCWLSAARSVPHLQDHVSAFRALNITMSDLLKGAKVVSFLSHKTHRIM